MRTKIAFLAGIAAALSFTIYCGGVPGAGGDEVPADAGGSTTCDCPAAKEPLVIEAQCDKHASLVPEGSERRDEYFAEVSVPGLKPDTSAPAINVLLCDRVYGVEGTPNLGNPLGVNLAFDEKYGYVAPSLPCIAGEPIVGEGKVLVNCGYFKAGNGFRFLRAIVRVQ